MTRPPSKSATIGGTVNLGNYENFRFEFSGPCETPEDYVNLSGFAARALIAQAAEADDVTRRQVKSYVSKVLGHSPVAEPDMGAVAPTKEAPPSKPAPSQERTCTTSGLVCEECGAPIDKTQMQMSRLFSNRTLCKKCFENLKNEVQA